MNVVYDEQKVQEIVQECADHNEEVGPDIRPPDRLRRDAEYIYMHRHCGISVETLVMMMTDYEFAMRKAKR